ncbi:1-acyl-sn-glycerol-3-phosphate acyltransferase [Achlya hypogyna]|uniref:1-acyl-sn-glycerol-3-phosphate acyltransferase n=1 Tax=Achlya hypogyna TaxID=1202772 RepID=A0A1V9YF22_ACHHY|nr:1-acyl-sn-glycerol-3-phosphate acyltransferase [Achlya hypogyna]
MSAPLLGLRAALGAAWIFLNMAILNLYQVWIVAFKPFGRRYARQLMGTLCFQDWIDFCSNYAKAAHLVVTGDSLPSDTKVPTIVIANHQVDADWWYILQLIRAQGGIANVKIVMKESLAKIPIFGWGMSMFESLFLRRDLAHDKRHVQRYMESFVDDGFPCWMLLFPEGTTIHQEYVAKSQAFAARQQRPQLQHVMLPRSAGLQLLLDAYAHTSIKPEIYDVTVAYSGYSGEVPTYAMGYDRATDKSVPNMKHVLARVASEPVHLHVTKHKYDDVVDNPEAFLDRQWVRKDALMHEFIEHQEFLSERASTREVIPESTIAATLRLWLGAVISLVLLPVALPCLLLATTVVHFRGRASAKADSL